MLIQSMSWNLESRTLSFLECESSHRDPAYPCCIGYPPRSHLVADLFIWLGCRWGTSVCGLPWAVLSMCCSSVCVYLSDKKTSPYFNVAASCDLNGYFLSREGEGDKPMAQVFTTQCITSRLLITGVIPERHQLYSQYTLSGEQLNR